MTSCEILELLTRKLDEKKAIDIQILDIGKISDFTDYFLICSGSNPNQLHTLLETVEENLDKLQIQYNVEGRKDSGWILIDCIDIVIHLFSDTEREFYDIEHMWQDGNTMDIEKFLPKRES